MATKKSESIQLQELANKSAKEIQSMINSANKLTMSFNATEAKKARDFNAQQVKLEQAYNSAEAEKSRKWQEQMSNTAHQREVKDLKKAGLNPVLSANSGAQSYTTSSASAGAGSASNASGSFESGAGAMSSILGGLMSSITGLKQSQMSANAQLQSSKISAEASKYASDIARENARTSAQAQVQSAKLASDATRYSAEKSYDAKMDQPQSNVVGLIDKYLGKRYGKKTLDYAEKVAKGMSVKYIKGAGKNYAPMMYSKNTDKALNKLGYNQYYINHLSLNQKAKLYDNFYKAFAKGDTKALKYFKK